MQTRLKTYIAFLVMAVIFSMPISSMAQTKSSHKILIVYLSRTNNTKVIAQIIQQNVGGTLVPLELQKPYPENYQQTVQQVVDENASGYLPPLKTMMWYLWVSQPGICKCRRQ
jgi:hypothetical protein